MSGFELLIGFYPGVLFGIRSYPEKTYTDHVFYIPFIELCLTIYYNDNGTI